MPLYSKRFFTGQVNATGAVVPLWTVPAGVVHVLRDLEVFTANVAATNVFLDIGANAVMVLNLQPNYATLKWEGRLVVNAGETVGAFVPSGSCVLTACGYELSSP
ncbi:MAG TPA: hypothetical protein VJR24_17565 [Gemmatimonadaceae bacterium]|nr:hypothetical protein [Gemmatimonadaceae bacterium]